MSEASARHACMETILDRRSGPVQATALNMNNMIGIGPFITIPLLMTALGGPQAMLGWIVALVIVPSTAAVAVSGGRGMIAVLLALWLSAAAGGQADDLAVRRQAAAHAMRDGRFEEAARLYRELVTLQPRDPSAWYALGQAYNGIKQDAIATFDARPEEAAWRQLLAGDVLLGNGRLTDAFFVYRAALERLPSMVSIHDSVAQIYGQAGHAAWAARERAKGALSAADCTRRRALCEFRAGHHQSALSAALAESDAESRYWRARAATELALAAFEQLDDLPDSAERRAVRATRARAEERYTDAITELTAALAFVPRDPSLTYELASSYYLARDFEQAAATLSPLLEARPEDARLLTLKGYSLLQLRRLDEAIPLLRRAMERDPADPGPRLDLGRAYVQNGDFTAAIPLIEAQLADDQDGSLHVQLARAYTGLKQKEKAAALLARSQELQRAADERARAAAKRSITPP